MFNFVTEMAVPPAPSPPPLSQLKGPARPTRAWGSCLECTQREVFMPCVRCGFQSRRGGRGPAAEIDLISV